AVAARVPESRIVGVARVVDDGHADRVSPNFARGLAPRGAAAPGGIAALAGAGE
nr:hypothetical protein [Tanacetum cinerariifolium]